jgi:hypothetical protein
MVIELFNEVFYVNFYVDSGGFRMISLIQNLAKRWQKWCSLNTISLLNGEEREIIRRNFGLSGQYFGQIHMGCFLFMRVILLSVWQKWRQYDLNFTNLCRMNLLDFLHFLQFYEEFMIFFSQYLSRLREILTAMREKGNFKSQFLGGFSWVFLIRFFVFW